MQEDLPRDSVVRQSDASEQLKPNRLMVYSGPRGSFGEIENARLLKAQTESIEWLSGPKKFEGDERQEQLGDAHYVMSRINSMHKASEDYVVCNASLAIGGLAREASQNTSFLTHQHPTVLLPGAPMSFAEDLATHLRSFVAQTKEGTREYVIFGGRFYERVDRNDPDAEFKNYYKDLYIASMNRLKGIFQEAIGVTPRVVGTPNAKGEKLSAFLDNTNRRLYITYTS